jgi:hypothetical protein
VQTDVLYQEKIYSKWLTTIFGFFTILLLFFIIYQLFIGPLGNHPAPNWVLMIMFLVLLGLTINFIALIIKITPNFISVGYGIFKHKIPWENVEGAYVDQAPNISYGGWGIRLGRVGGKWRLVYNIPATPRVVLSLKKGSFREFVFPTKNLAEVTKLIDEQITAL